MTSREYPKNSIAEIGQSTEESPGDKETWCHSDSSERPSANSDVKKSQEIIICHLLDFAVPVDYSENERKQKHRKLLRSYQRIEKAVQHEDLYLHKFTAWVGCDSGPIFKAEFFFSTSCHTKTKEPSLPYYLPISRVRIVVFILFSKALVLCKMQTASSMIWTHITVSISYDNNHYTTSTSTGGLYGVTYIMKWDFVVFLRIKKKRLMELNIRRRIQTI